MNNLFKTTIEIWTDKDPRGKGGIDGNLNITELANDADKGDSICDSVKTIPIPEDSPLVPEGVLSFFNLLETK
jgi:hypothetical protein